MTSLSDVRAEADAEQAALAERYRRAVAQAAAIFDMERLAWECVIHDLIREWGLAPKDEANMLISLLNIRLGAAVSKMPFRFDRERVLDRLRFVVSLIEEHAATEPVMEGFPQ
jgi:hypothetical protein